MSPAGAADRSLDQEELPHGWDRLLVEPPRPDAVRRRAGAHWLAVATVCVGAFMGQLDASIVTVAFPTWKTTFHTSLGAVEWVALAYLLVLVAAVTAVGRLADMVGRKLLYTYGFVVFGLASLGCGLAPGLPALVGFRVPQAIGAALLQANSVALIATVVPRHQLGRAIGIQGAAQAVGLALGPSVGGLLIGLAGWRLIFFVNVPVAAAGTVLAWFLLPRSRELSPRAPFDWTGLVLFAPATTCLLLALSLAGRPASAAAPPVFLAAAGVVLGWVFVRHELRAADPMLDPALFRRVRFSAGIGSGLLSYLVLFGLLFVVPFFLERVQRLTPGAAGLQLTVLPVAVGIVAPLAGRLADRLGPRLPTVAGMTITAGALAGLAVAHDSVALRSVFLAAAGIGLGLFTPANNAAIMSAAPRRQSGVAGGVLNMTRGIGTALGVALGAAVLALAGGSAGGERAGGTGHGFTAALWVLAVLAAVAGVVAGVRPAADPVQEVADAKQ